MAVEGFGMSTFILSMAHILQSAFLIAIIVEVILIFTSMKKGNSDANREDLAKFKIGKLGKDKDIERDESTEDKELRDGDSAIKDTDKLNEAEAAANMQADEDISKEIDEVEKIKQKITDPNINSNEVKSNLESLLDLTGKLKHDVLMSYKIIVRIRNKNEVFKRVLNYIDKKEKSLMSHYVEQVTTFEAAYARETNPTAKSTLKTARIKAQAKESEQKRCLEQVEILINTINSSIKEMNEKEQKIYIVERRIVTEINQLENQIKNINEGFNKLDDAETNQKNREELFRKLEIFQSNLNKFKEEWDQIKHANSSLINLYNERIMAPYNMLKNTISATRQKIHSM